jgi:microcompartment protein CcmL/EutN
MSDGVLALGMVELLSVARGIEVADVMKKTADIELLLSNSTCPGKYIILIRGEVSDVQSSVSEGTRTADDAFIDNLVLPNPHPEIFSAIAGTSPVDNLKALGIIETYSVSSSIISSDEGAKSANVSLINLRLAVALGGKSFCIFSGDVSAVRNAVENGSRYPSKEGLIVRTAIIPDPDPDLYNHII